MKPVVLTCRGEAETEEKRSRFIGIAQAVKSETEAKAVLAEIRAAHPRANHHVYAYITRGDCITRCSDNGEPHGTAGLPVLQVFERAGVVDFICVVVRYFGGTLLGTGGLVRAYTASAKAALTAAAPTEEILYREVALTCPYPRHDTLKYNLDKAGIEILSVDYTESCTFRLRVSEYQEDELKEITQLI
jgi:uncharacterized YigZ family protein